MNRQPFRVNAPGRICLFGEHSDYLGLGVIPVSINLNITIEAAPIDEEVVRVEYIDLAERDQFSTNSEAKYRHKRDYVRGAFNVVRRQRDFKSTSGWKMTISGEIPLAAGLSSSSALTVAAILSFAQMNGFRMTQKELAEAAYAAEVKEFGERGGMMDHYASVFGGPLYLDPTQLTHLPARLTGFVVGDSLEPKADTTGDLARIRSEAEEGYGILKRQMPSFDHRKTSLEQIESLADQLPDSCRLTTITTLRNRDLTNHGRTLLMQKNPDSVRVGKMINQHHTLLRDGLHRSTDKIEEMIAAATKAGALGCKINGSGGGGTMLAYAPGKEKIVSEAIESVDGVAYKVEIGQGATLTLI